LKVADRLVYRRARAAWELDQIRRLNYATFVEEIPQHEPRASRTLTDRFEDENRYYVACRGRRVLGMVAVREARPWSIDAKLEDVDSLLPAGEHFSEVRLLAIAPEHRGGMILEGLLLAIARDAKRRGITGAVISGTTRQIRLYERLGFIPFGPLVGREGAWYQPMYITVARFRQLRASRAPRRRAAGALSGRTA